MDEKEREKRAARERAIKEQYGEHAQMVDAYKPNREQRRRQAAAEKKKEREKDRGK